MFKLALTTYISGFQAWKHDVCQVREEHPKVLPQDCSTVDGRVFATAFTPAVIVPALVVILSGGHRHHVLRRITHAHAAHWDP
jgi:hypothetical protein